MSLTGNVMQVLAGSAEFRALNTPDKDRPEEAKEIAKLYRQLYRVRRVSAAIYAVASDAVA